MNTAMTKFNKVPLEQFRKDCEQLGFSCSDEDFLNIPMPQRASSCSAGYDICTPFEFTLKAGETITIPTGINIALPDDCVLLCVPRSGIGFKTNIRLSNTIGVIDADYINSDNSGHIMIRLTAKDKDYTFPKYSRIVQGIIIKYCVTANDCPRDVPRNGGFGSTGN